MKNAKIPKKDWIPVSDYLFDRLADHIISLGKGRNQTGENADWLNEIHPNKSGYKKIARLFEEKLKIVASVN